MSIAVRLSELKAELLVELVRRNPRRPGRELHITQFALGRSRKKPNADVEAGYSHSVALCMTIAAMQTGQRVTFDDAKQEVVIGSGGGPSTNDQAARAR